MYPYNTSYETLALRSFTNDKIVQGLRVDMASLALKPAQEISYVRTLVDKNSDTPAFAHPIIHDHGVFVDVRGLIAVTNAEGEFRIKDKGEYRFRIVRAAIERYWANDPDGRDELISASDLPLDIYCRYFSEGITHRLGLDPETQAKLAVVAGLFYLNCVEEEINEKTWERNVAIVARVTRVPAARIVEWFPEPQRWESIDELCHFISGEGLDNPRLSSLNPALLFGILSTGWFTQHGNEVMACALEFPPAWIACMYYAIGDRGLRKSKIGQLLQRSVKGDVDRLFQRAILSLIN